MHLTTPFHYCCCENSYRRQNSYRFPPQVYYSRILHYLSHCLRKVYTKAPYVCTYVCFLLLPLVGGLLPKDVASLLSDEVLPFTPVYTCMQIYVCMWVYMCMHACIYMYVCMYERRYLPMNCVDTSTIFSLMTTNSLNLEERT